MYVDILMWYFAVCYLNIYFFFLLGVLILNSMDEDFDDFKFAGSKSSDSS